MTTITRHDLPQTIRIGRVDYSITWAHNESLDGFVGRVVGLPIDDYESSEDLELEIYQSSGIPSDVYADGTGVLRWSI